MVLGIEDLRHRRAGVRGRADKALNTATTTVLANPAGFTTAQMQAQVNILERIQTTITELDAQILSELTDAAAIEADINEAGDYEERLVTTITILQETRNDFIKIASTAAAPVIGPVANPVPVVQHAGHSTRLPQLELPRFSGDPLQWTSFWDSYESAIHNNASLSDVDKFNYLRSLLKGVAFDSVSGIAITNANYPTAINLIRTRFGQQQAIISAHVEALVNLPKATEETSKLRALYDNAEIHIRGLATLNITAAQNGAVLTPILLTKIPDDIRLIITRKNGAPIADLDQLRDLLRTEIEARELSMLSKKPTSTRSYPHELHNEFTAGSLVSSTLNGYCGFCKMEGHRASDCSRYPTVKHRQAKAWEDGLCSNCLSSNHPQSECRSKNTCRRCYQKHHTSLCRQFVDGHATERIHNSKKKWVPRNRNGKSSNVTVTNTEANGDGKVTTTTHASPALLSNTASVWMQTAIAKVPDSTGKLHTARILFDSGSDRSYVTKAFASQAALKPTSTEVLSIAPFGHPRSASRRFDVTEFACADSNAEELHRLTAVIVPTITCPIFRAKLNNPSSVFKHMQLADPPKKASEWSNIDILIGLDHYWEFVNDQIVRLPDEGLIAMSSVLGWLISGTMHHGDQRQQQSSALFIASSNCLDDNYLTKFWESESLEFAESPSSKNSVEQDLVLRQFDDTIKIKNNRYEVGLPWKQDCLKLPTNYGLSMKRFKSLVNRLTRENLIPQYNEVITYQLNSGFLEEVTDAEATDGIVHYIPHHPVIRKDHATTKLRIVYDASAKQSAHHPSLNESLHSGPNLINDLFGLLLEFRRHKIVLLADIEKAFLQVGLQVSDRDATRFFWLKEASRPLVSNNIAIYRFKRVPFGATSSPFLLAATLRYHLSHTEGTTAKKMLGHFYVDNLVTGVNDVDEGVNFYIEAKKIMSDVGMNLREWVSNSNEFVNTLPQADRASGTVIKVLGIPWNITEDNLYLKGAPVLSETRSPPTKRLILQTIAKVFDPLGFGSPVVIKAKIFIQSLWKLGLHWDQVPPQELLNEWSELETQLSQLDQIKVPRRVDLSDNSELHVFVDASSKAYAAVAYLRTPTKDAFVTNMICSKSRVAPVKSVTTPRLELMAALVGCQVADFIKRTYPVITKVQLWSDSEVVLHWINNPTQKQGVFVSNRTQSIKGYMFPFRYVPTKENPADLPSRGVNIDTLQTSIWWDGPAWLQRCEDKWPKNTVTVRPSVSTPAAVDSVTTVTKASVRRNEAPFDIDISRFSSLNKLLTVTSYCSRFVQCLQRKTSNGSPITAEEYNSSSMRWIMFVQQEHYQDQLIKLQNKQSDTTTRSLNLFLEDGILRCHGRLGNAAVSYETNNPILLPRKNPLTDLVILDQHQKLFHQGVRHTLSTLRQTYWIPCGRQQVRFVLKRCRVCRIWEGSAYSNPLPPPLPSFRVTRNPAFTYIGCDFAGPLLVFHTGVPSKVYICLFTCAVTRAVHLELVGDMTTQCFIMALRRFISRRGCPQEIISDNAKTFKLSKLVIDKLWHNFIITDDIQIYVANQGIKWKFNVERAPWWGGFFEKMVGLTKRSLLKAIGRSKLTSIELTTVLAEVEAVLNSRPLTYVSDNLYDGLPLRPSNFLSETTSFGLPPTSPDLDPEYNDPASSTTSLIHKLRIKQRALDKFWKIWLNEYLPSLREVHQQRHKDRRNNPYAPRNGDVVLIKQDGLKRAHWKMGIVQQLFLGRDSQVRAVQVRCKDGQLLQRPISLLYPLEIESATTKVLTQQDPPLQPRSQRPAAVKANKAIKAMYQDGQNEHNT